MAGLALLAGLALIVSCGEGNPGVNPPPDQLVFPVGVMVDPRTDLTPSGPCETQADCGAGELCGEGGCREPARWLFVTNANSDRRYNAGSLLAIDLNAYWEAAFASPGEVRRPGAELDVPGECSPGECQFCRQVANLPQVVECRAEPFVAADATIYFGNFPGPTSAWNRDPDDGEAMLLIPVRGDPSITYAEISGGLSGANDLRIECGQASGPDGGPDGGRRCDDRYRLRFLRNDPEASRLSREPFRVLVSPQADLPLAYISHQGDEDLTVMALEGLAVGGDGRPAIVHQPNILTFTPNPGAFAFQGGFGLAQRPCDLEADNVPNSTLGCTRPLVYASLRWQLELQTMTAVSHEPLPETEQRCVGPDEIGIIGGIICEPQAEPLERVSLSGLSTVGVPIGPARPLLGDIGFSRAGDQLYVVQSNPGGLLRVDTSLGDNGEPLNIDVGQVEVCAQPTSLAIYDDGANEYGIVTCYRSGEVFIVDLAVLTVVGLSRAGIGPDAIAVDLAREVIYVGNSLDATVSIIDMSRTRSARFTEIGRIGLQEAYVQ